MVPSQASSSFQILSLLVSLGCLNLLLASYPMLSSGLLFSPTSCQLGFPQLLLSPTVPLPLSLPLLQQHKSTCSHLQWTKLCGCGIYPTSLV
ncbi:hypothetical protein JHK82_011375 [Glycine max]|uniref:Uncharacterized protein n=1 Tax=Glycine soja TaxID=3848 RepID=A0A445KH73_GLYSO|nr:hypothetical protein JHK85_011692 [Glycine max]KAG5056369.1 hypothetical protein JHK86_011365 [Glycine max]KAG5153406.1 hypothetical protein JHK82_011375 [Glycine max]RZC10241.1 hypothetical protein D0Y65_010846 [Glycine soja]